MGREITLLLAGDALIARPWSHVREADFLGLIDEIRAADVAIVNLETVIHEFKGHAQADSGGTYMASPPQRAKQWTTFADLGSRLLSQACLRSHNRTSARWSARQAALSLMRV